MTKADNDEKVVLLVGSCGLDRLLTVAQYPDADAKVRTNDYNEVGGGNAANTASAMSLLSTASFLPTEFKIKLLTKVGDDMVGKAIIEELEGSGVDLSSPLFQVGGEGTTTGFTTVIVSAHDNTRTCIHTPGTCGELAPADIMATELDTVFENVMHLHSDCRHTDVALMLAKEAKLRGITVSLDAEKDRNIESQHGLMDCADILFTNSQQLEAYFAKRTQDLEAQSAKGPLPKAQVTQDDEVEESLFPIYTKAIEPSAFFSRWCNQHAKEVIITKGSIGSLHISCTSHTTDEADEENSVHVHTDGKVTHKLGESGTSTYSIRTSGILEQVDVIDTTGAGDAFIGGYLLSMLAMEGESSPKDNLQLGAWVSGRKVEGSGARSTLPTGQQVDDTLGTTHDEVKSKLSELLGSFGSSLGTPIASTLQKTL